MSDSDDEIVKKDLKVGKYTLPDEYVTGPYQAEGDVKNENGVVTGGYIGGGMFQVREGDAELRGPNVGFGAEVSEDNVRAVVKAEVIGVSASADDGAATATLGLSADTGVGIGKSGVEAKFLGTGFSFGRKIGLSLFGSGFEIDFSKW